MPSISTQVHSDDEWNFTPKGASPFIQKENYAPVEHERQNAPSPAEVLKRSVSGSYASTSSSGLGSRDDCTCVSLPMEAEEGRKFTLEIDPDETVWRLKQKIQKSR